ncbi:hypothetical protein DFH09DRAFT_1171907 [Mycena vulgaris]|nr:hypothetical protein DFH09DRAFT_1171907 [Mycena vulgaris]
MATTAPFDIPPDPPPLLQDSIQIELIRDLLRSHRQLPSDQLTSIVSSVADELDRYDERIGTLQAELTRLAANRAALQSRYHDCRSLRAPIRRLPSEILGEIFALSSAAHWETNRDCPPPTRALERLAQMPFLTLSQVCARWHAIALGTPAFWSDISLDAVLWTMPTLTETAVTLLGSALDRSGDFPLTVRITNHMISPAHGPALELLSKHSERWQTAILKCPVADLAHLSSVKGRLPLLETLEVDALEPELEIAVLDLFELAPRLRNISVAGDLVSKLVKPPLGQLKRLGYTDLASTDIARVVSSMSSLAQGQQFQIQFFLDDWTSNRSHTLQLGIPPTSSDVSRLSVDLVGQFHHKHCLQAMSAILANLTLPHLETLEFHTREYPRFPVVWSHVDFLSLSARSSFHRNLRSLCLYHVHIAESQLLQSLAMLPALEHLEISDHERIGGRGVNLVLISDTLLRALTCSDTQGLVPHLNDLRLCSRLQFTDDVYLGMVLSRIESGRMGPFTAVILLHLRNYRALDPVVVARLHELQAEKSIVFKFMDAE